MNDSEWFIDRHQGIAKHRQSGLEVEVQGDTVINIISMPDGIDTKELPKLLHAAIQAFNDVPVMPKKKSDRPILKLKNR